MKAVLANAIAVLETHASVGPFDQAPLLDRCHPRSPRSPRARRKVENELPCLALEGP